MPVGVTGVLEMNSEYATGKGLREEFVLWPIVWRTVSPA
jgi:hypothetical protein